jgi:hypothetical protein
MKGWICQEKNEKTFPTKKRQRTINAIGQPKPNITARNPTRIYSSTLTGTINLLKIRPNIKRLIMPIRK